MKLGKYFEITSGGTPRKGGGDYYEGGNIPWVRTGDLKVKNLRIIPGRITQLGLDKSSAKLFPCNTVLLAMYGATIGNCSILKIEAATNQACAAFLPNSNVNHDFLYFYLKSIKNELIGMGVGGGQPNISGKILKNIEVNFPSLDNQKRIAKVLSDCETLIQKRKESIELLDEFLKSTFLEMFGDPVRNDKGWEIVPLGIISEVGSGKRVFVNELVDNGIPFFRGTEIGKLSEGTKIEPKLFIKETHYQKLKEHTGVPKIGDLLMPSICPDGRILRVTDSKPFYFKDGRVLWIKVDESIISSVYLREALKEIFRKNYKNIASGTTFAELKILALKKIIIPTPPKNLQHNFDVIVEHVEKLKISFSDSLTELENLYGSLSQKAFKGKLDLSKVDVSGMGEGGDGEK